MTNKKPPGDATMRGLPGFAARAEDSFIGNTSSGIIKKLAETAPEVSQGAWRERVFTPRAVMSHAEIKQGLTSSLRAVLSAAHHSRAAFDALRAAWLPLLRQALEQAGGDGIDVWLNQLFAQQLNQPRQLLFVNLGDCLQRMRSARELAMLEEEALKLVALVDDAWAVTPSRLSFKQMERQLEGKLEVDELLGVRGGSTDDLNNRMEELGATLSQLRDQIRSQPGRQPDGMYANFVRLKFEARVLDAELNRRRG